MRDEALARARRELLRRGRAVLRASLQAERNDSQAAEELSDGKRIELARVVAALDRTW